MRFTIGTDAHHPRCVCARRISSAHFVNQRSAPSRELDAGDLSSQSLRLAHEQRAPISTPLNRLIIYLGAATLSRLASIRGKEKRAFRRRGGDGLAVR